MNEHVMTINKNGLTNEQIVFIHSQLDSCEIFSLEIQSYTTHWEIQGNMYDFLAWWLHIGFRPQDLTKDITSIFLSTYQPEIIN